MTLDGCGLSAEDSHQRPSPAGRCPPRAGPPGRVRGSPGHPRAARRTGRRSGRRRSAGTGQCRPAHRVPSRRPPSWPLSRHRRAPAPRPGDARRPSCDLGGRARPVTDRASTRRTLVSSDRMAMSERERRDGGCRVVADARQRPELRRTTAGTCRHGARRSPRRRVQAERPARGTRAVPRPGSPRPVAATARSAGAGHRSMPGTPHRLDAGDRSLLEHELADEHAPRRPVRGAPGQVAGMVVEPGDDGVVHGAQTVQT